jgi:hypothetical protein
MWSAGAGEGECKRSRRRSGRRGRGEESEIIVQARQGQVRRLIVTYVGRATTIVVIAGVKSKAVTTVTGRDKVRQRKTRTSGCHTPTCGGLSFYLQGSWAGWLID